MKRARFWVGMALSGICLYLALRGLHFVEIQAALGRANYAFLLPAAAIIIASQWVRAVRWGMLFYPRLEIGQNKLFFVLNIGYFLSSVLPARIGDVARAYLLGPHVPAAQALATVILERALDVLIVILLLILLIPVVPIPAWVAQGGMLLGVAFIVLVLAMVVATVQRERGLRWLRRGLERVPGIDPDRLMRQAKALLDGMAVLRAPRQLTMLLVFSVGLWATPIIVNYLVMLGFGMRLSWVAAAFVLCVTALGVAVPSSPGYIGVYHAAVVASLAVFGVSSAEAFAYALVLHAVNYTVLIVLGVFSMWRESLSPAAVQREVSQRSQFDPQFDPRKQPT